MTTHTATITETHQCSEKVGGDKWSRYRPSCSKQGKYEEMAPAPYIGFVGPRKLAWFCGTHAPSRIAQRAADKRAVERKQYERRLQQIDAAEARAAAVRQALGLTEPGDRYSIAPQYREGTRELTGRFVVDYKAMQAILELVD